MLAKKIEKFVTFPTQYNIRTSHLFSFVANIIDISTIYKYILIWITNIIGITEFRS